MELYGQKSKSIPQKIFIQLVEIILIWISYWILFQNGGEWCEQHLPVQNAADTNRRIILFAFHLVIFARIAFGLFYLLKRKMLWEESISIAFAFVLYFLVFSLLVLPESKSIDGLDYFAITMFITGCVLNTGGEIQRHRWKIRSENKGRIYTKGFFRYSRHVNYFGDLLWVTAYALVTKNWIAALIPALLFLFFAFYNAPKLDEYLKNKYGKDYDEYAKKTKMIIPFIY